MVYIISVNGVMQLLSLADNYALPTGEVAYKWLPAGTKAITSGPGLEVALA